jgi:hypothetical protein
MIPAIDYDDAKKDVAMTKTKRKKDYCIDIWRISFFSLDRCMIVAMKKKILEELNLKMVKLLYY